MKNKISAMQPTITIRLKPHLQEFVNSELRNNTLASRKNLLGVIIKPFREVFPVNYIQESGDPEDLFTFSLPLDHGIDIDSRTCYISAENQKIIEDVLEWHFRDLFFHYMDDKMRYFKSFKNCILQFCSDTDISFTKINYEMLKKCYYRRRKLISFHSRYKENFNGKNVPGRSLGCPYGKPSSDFIFINQPYVNR
jgi:hypothetical protein